MLRSLTRTGKRTPTEWWSSSTPLWALSARYQKWTSLENSSMLRCLQNLLMKTNSSSWSWRLNWVPRGLLNWNWSFRPCWRCWSPTKLWTFRFPLFIVEESKPNYDSASWCLPFGSISTSWEPKGNSVERTMKWRRRWIFLFRQS